MRLKWPVKGFTAAFHRPPKLGDLAVMKWILYPLRWLHESPIPGTLVRRITAEVQIWLRRRLWRCYSSLETGFLYRPRILWKQQGTLRFEVANQLKLSCFCYQTNENSEKMVSGSRSTNKILNLERITVVQEERAPMEDLLWVDPIPFAYFWSTGHTRAWRCQLNFWCVWSKIVRVRKKRKVAVRNGNFC